MQPLELYIHIPFCVKNVHIVISYPVRPEKRKKRNM